ncbi:hypothetical protein [Paenibacillus hunanensis]|uniref:Spore coat protein n=1 Tax=Paenibacillus hunanensis TaxID=539262 RepID=A0ABU1IZZ6_9BACL|nr:hypothetical protein [Paenibacillus hunanensis]MCL9659116.1 hypothetical protein [Paenibacillus hunanensis]MDR6244516.1 hypothetical protein [Paenibacillus hunanensis]
MQQTNDDTEFLFNVDLMITGKNNAVALQKLLDILNNQQELADFRVVNGIKLGVQIEQAIQAAGQQQTAVHIPASMKSKPSPASPPPTTTPNETPAPKDTSSSQEDDMGSWLSMYIESSQLIRVTINRRGERMSIPCRILKYDNDDQTISVYHVDEKQVYTFKLNEIDDFQQT